MSEFDKKAAKIEKELAGTLSPSRLRHTRGVMYTAQALAMRYDVDIEKAGMAGLLHDCAKGLSDKEMLKRCKKAGLLITEAEQKNPSLLHAKLGAYYAKEQYGIMDEEVLDAICCHTTGKPAMTRLEMILFLADYMEPGRDKAENLPLIRKSVFASLEKSVYLVARDTLAYLEQTGVQTDMTTYSTYCYYKDYCMNHHLI